MSIANVHSTPSIVNYYIQSNLDQQLEDACKSGDLDQVKDLIRQGANPNLEFELSFTEQANFITQIKDPDFLGVYFKFMSNEMIEETDGEVVNNNPFSKVANYLAQGNQFSKEFLVSCRTVFQEILPIILSEEDQQSFEDLGFELNIFNLAVNILDRELLDLLVEAKGGIDGYEFEDVAAFVPGLFTPMRQEMIEHLLSLGFSMENLIEYDMSYDDIIHDAIDHQDQLLLDFLESKGIFLTEIKEEVLEEQIIHKLENFHNLV